MNFHAERNLSQTAISLGFDLPSSPLYSSSSPRALLGGEQGIIGAIGATISAAADIAEENGFRGRQSMSWMLRAVIDIWFRIPAPSMRRLCPVQLSCI